MTRCSASCRRRALGGPKPRRRVVARAILAFAQRGVGHEQDAEDVAQEVFLRISLPHLRLRPHARWSVLAAFGIAAFEASDSSSSATAADERRAFAPVWIVMQTRRSPRRMRS